jgi:hypothetical protein
MRRKVAMICFQVLSKHLLDGLPEYKALHISYEFTDKKYHKHERQWRKYSSLKSHSVSQNFICMRVNQKVKAILR